MNAISYFHKKDIRETLVLAYPIVLSQLGHVLVGIVDTAIVGQIGTIEQAAVALANAFHFLILIFGIGISFGVTPLVAAADGAGNTSENTTLLKHTLFVNGLTGILLFLLLFLSSPVLYLLDQPLDVVDIAVPFLNVLMLGMIPLCIFSGLKQFAEGLSFTRVAMFISVGANLLNVLLNYLMVFGHWGFPEMGVKGSCWASFIARAIMAIAMFLYIYYNSNFIKYRKGFRLNAISKNIALKILRIGIPSGLQWFFEIGTFSFAIIMMGWISSQAQAAHQIGISLASFTYMAASGMAGATSVRVGNHFGIKDEKGVRRAAFTGMLIVVLTMCICALFFMLFRNNLAFLFTTDKEVIALASTLIIIAAFFQISDGLQAVALGMLRGIQDVKTPTIITLVAYWGLGLPLCYLFGFTLELGPKGVWYGLASGLTISAVLLLWRFNYISKKIKV
jgi:multidrug resistance protein, MATE family